MRALLLFLIGADVLLLTACGSTSSGDSADGATASSGSVTDGTISNGVDGAASSPGHATDDAASVEVDAALPPDATVAADTSTGEGDEAGPTNPVEAGPRPARPSAACSADAGSLATGNVNLTYGGTARTYLLHVPVSAGTAPRPLVLSLHGYFLDGASQEKTTGMSALADSEGFVVAYPDGLGSPRDWNAGACCSAASEGDRDDKGFLGAVIDDIGAHVCIDLARVYVEGFSNGGMMTVRLACEMADRFAAAATVSGSAVVPLDTCRPSQPIAFMHIHGNHDPLVPYDGGAGGLPLKGRPTPIFPPVAQEIATLRGGDECPPASDVYFDEGNAHCDHWGPGDAGSEVIFCTIDGGTHAWPAPSGTNRALNETSNLDATTQIWKFMQRHALP